MYLVAPRPERENERNVGCRLLITHEDHREDRSHAGQQPIIDSV